MSLSLSVAGNCRLGRTVWSWLLSGSSRTLRLLRQAPALLLLLALPSTLMMSS